MSKKGFKKEPKIESAIPSIISKRVYEHEELSSGAKVFWGMLNFLARPKNIEDEAKPVFATNGYFHRSMGRNSKYAVRAIQGYVKELVDHEFIMVYFNRGLRYIQVKSVTRGNDNIASYISGEVVKDSRLSSSKKLTLGHLSWKSTNKNGYYNITVSEFAEESERHKSTIYRHLEEFQKLKYITIDKNGSSLDIYCHTTLQGSYEAKKRIKELEKQALIDKNLETFDSNAPPVVTDPGASDVSAAYGG